MPDIPPSPRYLLGDEIWALTTYREKVANACQVCEGTGKVAIAADPGMLATCPADGCRFGEVPSQSETLFASIQRGTIGKITAEIVRPDRDRPGHVEQRVAYMLYETGVGSGQNWPEHRLHPSRAEAAVAAEDLGAVDDHGEYARRESMARALGY